MYTTCKFFILTRAMHLRWWDKSAILKENMVPSLLHDVRIRENQSRSRWRWNGWWRLCLASFRCRPLSICVAATRIPGIWNLPVTNQWSSISRCGFLSQSSKRAINPSKINTKQTPNQRQLPTQSVIRHFICSRLLFASCCAVWSKVGKEKGSVQ